jgi:hypothetical protein
LGGAASTAATKLPTYKLQLGDIDELIDKVFTVASIGHKAFTSGLYPAARQYLIAENEVEAWKPT